MNPLWLVLWIIVPLAVLMAWSQADAIGPKEELTQVRREIMHKQKALLHTKSEEQEKRRRVELADMRIKEQKRRVESANRQVAELQVSIKNTNAEAGIERTARDLRKNDMHDRLRGIIRGLDRMPESAGYLSLNGFMPEEITRHAKQIVGADQSSINQREKRLGLLNLKISGLKGEKHTQQLNLSAGRKEIVKAEHEKGATLERLARLKDEREKIATELNKMEARQKSLQSLLARLQKRQGQKSARVKSANNSYASRNNDSESFRSGVSAMPGWFEKFAMPVNGTVLRRFGLYRNPAYNTTTFSNGITIQASVESEVRSIASGMVIFSAPFKGYGNLMVVDHGDKVYSLYGNCSAFRKQAGEHVSRNETIAGVGKLESDPGTGLYFELRNNGKPVNPLSWLRRG